MKVVVTSRERVKPSSPTPDHLRHLQQSFLDQIHLPNIVPFLHFYKPEGGSNTTIPARREKCDRLKKSLSETLTRFYPLAGRLRVDNLVVDCNDEGVPFVEARVHCRLEEVVMEPNYGEFKKLIPCEQLENSGDLLLQVQVNVFDCGGIAIGNVWISKFLKVY